MARIDALFDKMLESRASDLHLAEGQVPKLRLHGHIVPVEGETHLDRHAMAELLREICSPERWSHYEESGDLDFAYGYADKARFRANYLKRHGGMGAVFRTIPSEILSLADLKAPKILGEFADYRSGLVLVTGPTGSGKSTTLAAIINEINTRHRRIILTIEEPVEFVHPNKESTIIQREVGVDVPSFYDGIRASGRQDADVILVGEMRDQETIGQAVAAAEKGVLVFGTLHTNNASKSVYRIIDVFPTIRQNAIRESLAVTLRAVCAQLLLRRKDGAGRLAAHEIFIQTRASQNMIRENNIGQIYQVIMSGRAQGMQGMDDVIQRYHDQGLITGEEAYMKAVDKERFAQFAPK